MNNSNGKCTDCQFLDPTPTVSDLQLGQPFPQVQLISGLGSTNTPIGLPRPEQVANIDNGSELCNVCEMPFCANHIVGSSGRCIYCVIDGLREIDREYVKSLLFAFGNAIFKAKSVVKRIRNGKIFACGAPDNKNMT